MNTKDYENIASIIKKHHRIGKDDWESKIVNIHDEFIAKDLADYFEREDDKESGISWRHQNFNRATFLKDCGVD